ncbi:MAG: penicillin acylase family protein, partial [Bacteroidales bacterium]|nr:penicillin acylase family protein [Bacteroidales bacterium]
MYRSLILLLFVLFQAGISICQDFTVPGLLQPVEVIRDRFGVNHIYAQNEHDLFFSQGYLAARDRLFQFEVWRRQATGTAAEILGKREINRDIGARLFRFRGNMTQEMNHYHPGGEQIIIAFTEGVNAYIREALKNKSSLPVEFKLLGIEPGFWTPEIVISRHQGLLGNIGEEIQTTRRLIRLGPEKVKDLGAFGPADPQLTIDPVINTERLFDDFIALYNAYRSPLTFSPEDVIESARNKNKQTHVNYPGSMQFALMQEDEFQSNGSNNWTVSGELAQSGYPLLANDPHRAITTPSLRYLVHLHAPGWNVVGAGEPTIPGISIGHNEYGAWGITFFSIDWEDLYVYKINPENHEQYEYLGQWENMIMIKDTIKVKSSADVIVRHRYTRHGPVTFSDTVNHIAYAMRCAWLEKGCSPYLGSLRIDQARDWDEFREACKFCYIPGENIVWAGRNGEIGWQASGIAPIRKNWSGLVLVPGDGRYEWSGFLPVELLPNVYNPPKGFWSTANQNLAPLDYQYNHAIGLSWG